MLSHGWPSVWWIKNISTGVWRPLVDFEERAFHVDRGIMVTLLQGEPLNKEWFDRQIFVIMHIVGITTLSDKVRILTLCGY